MPSNAKHIEDINLSSKATKLLEENMDRQAW